MESGWGTSSGCFALRTDLPRHTGPELAAGRRKIRRSGRRWPGEPIGRPAARGSSTTTIALDWQVGQRGTAAPFEIWFGRVTEAMAREATRRSLTRTGGGLPPRSL